MYDATLLVDYTTAALVTCALCSNILRDPVLCRMCPKSDNYCRKCLIGELAEFKKCPKCKDSVAEKDLVASSLDGIITRTCIIHCPSTLKAAVEYDSRIEGGEPATKKTRYAKNDRPEDGNTVMESASSSVLSTKCTWKGSIQAALLHMQECAFATIQCPHKCNYKVHLSQLDAHVQQCPYRLVACDETACCDQNTQNASPHGVMQAHTADEGAHPSSLISTIEILQQTVKAQECIIRDLRSAMAKNESVIRTTEKEDIVERWTYLMPANTAAHEGARDAALATNDGEIKMELEGKNELGGHSTVSTVGRNRFTYYIDLYNDVLCGSVIAWDKLRNLSAAGDHDAKVYEMVLYQHGTCGSLVPIDRKRANNIATSILSWMQTESRKKKRPHNSGSVHAVFGLALCQYHEYALVLPTNNKEAVRLLRIAHKSGHSPATSFLGCCCLYGHGVNKNKSNSTIFYTKAADAGFADAMCGVGMNFDIQGERASHHKETAFSWYLRAAKLGHCESQYNVGVCYHNKCGVKRDSGEGDRWLRLSADQGYPPAVQYFECSQKREEQQDEGSGEAEQAERSSKQLTEISVDILAPQHASENAPTTALDSLI